MLLQITLGILPYSIYLSPDSKTRCQVRSIINPLKKRYHMPNCQAAMAWSSCCPFDFDALKTKHRCFPRIIKDDIGINFLCSVIFN